MCLILEYVVLIVLFKDYIKSMKKSHHHNNDISYYLEGNYM